MDEGVDLTRAIQSLRWELAKALNEGAREWLRFSVAPIELTLQTVVTKEANGKIGWKVVEAGGKYQSAVTQTLTLTLTPVLFHQDGSSTETFTIAGEGSEEMAFGRDPELR